MNSAISLSQLKKKTKHFRIPPKAVCSLKITDSVGKNKPVYLHFSKLQKYFLTAWQYCNSHLSHYSIFRKKKGHSTVANDNLQDCFSSWIVCVCSCVPSGCLICEDQSPPAVLHSLTCEYVRLSCQPEGGISEVRK